MAVVDKSTEVTGAQSVGYVVSNQLTLDLPTDVTYDTYRAMRNHPTLALARALTVAPIVAGQWSTFAEEDANEDAIKFIEDEMLSLRPQIMERALLSGIDFGWQGWEKIFEVGKDERVHLKRLKPLLHDITDIMIDPKTGAFAGFQQRSGQVKLELNKSLLISWRVEGTDWYGEPLLENARSTYTAWAASNSAATRYDNKIAGAHFIVHYPVGSTTVSGTLKDNFDIASDILQALEGSGSIAIPKVPIDYVEKLSDQTGPGWEIELLSDQSPKQPSFIDRMDYLDKQFVRAMLWPERALLEGKYGTKAEASVHAGAALTNMELTDLHITRHINWYVVDHLLAMNFGEDSRGTVKLESSPILDERQQFLRDVFLEILKDPAGFAELTDFVDIEALFDRLDIPKLDAASENIEEYKDQLVETVRRLSLVKS